MLVDETYYTNTFYGNDIEDFDKQNARSQAIILSMIRMDESEASSHERVSDIKNAICSQIELLANNGEVINRGKMQSESIGSYSYTISDKYSFSEYENIPISPMVYIYLKGLIKGGTFINVC